MTTLGTTTWLLAAAFATGAGVLDWRSRRIPNWYTIPGALAGIAINSMAYGVHGARSALAGIVLGLLLLLPLVALGGLGGGDWKLMGALGAFTGPWHLLRVLAVTVFVNAAMALAMIIRKRRLLETLRNMGYILLNLVTFRPSPVQMTLDNPDLVKVPFGVAAAAATVGYTIYVLGYALGGS